MHVEGAVRLEHTDHHNSELDDDINFTTFSLSTGADIQVTEQLNIGGTVFRTERAPNTEELYSNGPHLATTQFEIGDPDLDIETALGIELALRHNTPSTSFSANLFYTDYDDYIYERESDQEMEGLPVFVFTAEDASFTGFELQGQMELPKLSDLTGITQLAGLDLSVDGQASFVRAKTDTENLPRIPPLSLLAGIDASTERYSLRVELDYAATSEDLTEFEIETENYLLTNLFASYNWPSDFGDVTLLAALENAFDEDARQHSSFLKDVAPLPGRNFRLSLGLKF